MKRGILAAGAILAAAVFTGCIDGGFGPTVRASIDETRPMSVTGELSLENTNGSVRVATWDEPQVRVHATKSAPNQRLLERIEVLVEGQGDHVTVRTRQPRTGFWLGGSGGVAYEITVPRSAHVSVRNVNGRVVIDGVAGHVRAQTVNGTVEARNLGSEVEATTTNGSVEVAMARVDPAGRNRLSTTNGSVRLVLPRDASADLDARTVNGSVHSDFDLVRAARSGRRRLEGRIGAGGARFELRTVNGAARIEQGLASARETEAPPSPAAR